MSIRPFRCLPSCLFFSITESVRTKFGGMFLRLCNLNFISIIPSPLPPTWLQTSLILLVCCCRIWFLPSSSYFCTYQIYLSAKTHNGPWCAPVLTAILSNTCLFFSDTNRERHQQEGPLSPKLFISCLEMVFCKMNWWGEVSANGERLNQMPLVNDIILIVEQCSWNKQNSASAQSTKLRNGV